MSAEDAMPLEAAHVMFKGADIGTTTNDQGFFMIRSLKPEKKLEVSIVGYKTKTVRLSKGRDQMLEIFLEEKIDELSEIILLPGENPAFRILRKIDENRERNDPDNITNIEYTQQKDKNLNLTNIKQKSYQRRMFRDIMKGAVSKEDSSYFVPVYIDKHLTTTHRQIDSVSLKSIDRKSNSVDILAPEHWKSFLDTYTPDANFYKPYITFAKKTILSPISRQGTVFYKYYLTDSIVTPENKHYIISFAPKAAGSIPLLKGSMSVCAETYALVSVNAYMPSSANINWVNDMVISQETERIDTTKQRFYSTTSTNVGLRMSIVASKKSSFWGATVSESNTFGDVAAIDTGLALIERVPQVKIELDSVDQNLWEKIDTIKQAKLVKFTKWAVDLGIFQYLHLWKIDVGPVLNLFHYNELEGASPRLTLRSGRSFAENFTFGGYFGYGFKDKEYKYGGEIRWRFGAKKYNTLSAFYDRKTVNYGFEDYFMFNENKVEEKDHLFNSPFQIDKTPYIGLREQLKLSYKYERPGFRFMSDVFASKTFSNEFMPFVHNGIPIEHYGQLSMRVGFRTSSRERSIDGHFHRFYLSSDRPIFNSLLEGGLIKIDQNIYPYGKLTLSLKQQVSFLLGTFAYNIEAGGVLGKVPYTNLYIPRPGRSLYYSKSEFVLMDEFEFHTDVFIGARLQYQTPGLIFGYIPYLQKLGIRENFTFNIAYGGLLQKHEEVLALPSGTKSFGRMPYMEAGVGFSNILRLLTVQSIWRLTYRDNPNAANWAIRVRLDLDF